MTRTPSNFNVHSNMRNIISIFAALLVFLFLFRIFLLHQNPDDGLHELDIDGGWTVVTGSETFEDVNLDDLVFDMQNKGDVVEVSRVLPTEKIMDPVLMVNTVHAMIEVFLDDELIYSYGQEEKEKDFMLGFGNHYISMSEDYMGKTLFIRYTFTENNAINYIYPISLHNGNYLYRDFIIEHKLSLCIDLTLIIYGLFFMVVFLIFSIKDSRYTRLMDVALFALCIGTWSLCNNNYISLFSFNLREKALLEYWTLYFAPVALLLYFFNDPEYLRVKWIRALYKFFFGLHIAFIFVVGALSSTKLNILHLPDVLLIAHIMIAVEFFVMMAMCIDRYRTYGSKKGTIIWAMMIMLVFTVFDLVVYNVQKYVEAIADKHFTSISAIGIFVFVFAILLDFVNGDMEATKQKALSEALNEMAYKDALTGCHSRRWFEEKVDHFPRGEWYGVIMYDLNLLKYTNDTHGHVMGDRLLVEFSGILKSVFSPVASVCRIGGDEFCIIFDRQSMVDVYQLMQRADAEMQKSSDPEHDYVISAARGYVDWNMYPNKNLTEACKIADQLMYQNKENTKHGRK